jgi:hypothetical protein
VSAEPVAPAAGEASTHATIAWTAHLDALDDAVMDASRPMPRTDDLPALPPALADRARRALEAVRAAAAELAERRDAVAAELAELGASRPRPAQSRPVYLDATG